MWEHSLDYFRFNRQLVFWTVLAPKIIQFFLGEYLFYLPTPIIQVDNLVGMSSRSEF